MGFLVSYEVTGTVYGGFYYGWEMNDFFGSVNITISLIGDGFYSIDNKPLGENSRAGVFIEDPYSLEFSAFLAFGQASLIVLIMPPKSLPGLRLRLLFGDLGDPYLDFRSMINCFLI